MYFLILIILPILAFYIWMDRQLKKANRLHKEQTGIIRPPHPKAKTEIEQKQCSAIEKYIEQLGLKVLYWEFKNRARYSSIKYGFLPDINVFYKAKDRSEPVKQMVLSNLLYIDGKVLKKEDEQSIFWKPLRIYMDKVVHDDFDETVVLDKIELNGNNLDAHLIFSQEKVDLVIPYSYSFVTDCFEQVEFEGSKNKEAQYLNFRDENYRLEHQDAIYNHLIKKRPKRRIGEYLTRRLAYKYYWGDKQDVLDKNPESDYAFVPFNNELLKQYTDVFIDYHYRVTGYLTEGYHYVTDEGIYFLRYRGTDYYKQTKNESILKANFEDIKDVGEFAEYSIPMYIFKDYKGYVKKMWNVYIPAGNGYYQEIDMIAITEYGIFAFECKYRSLPVSIPENLLNKWEDRNENKFQSPVEQNKGHIKFLRRFLDDNGYKDMQIYNLICFFAKREKCREWNEERKDIDTFFKFDSLYKEETGRFRVYAYENKNKDTLIGTHAEVKEKLDARLQGLEKKYTESDIDDIYEVLAPQILFSEEKKMGIVAMNKKLHEDTDTGCE